MQYKNISALFREQVKRYKDRPAYYVRREGLWKPLSWNEWNERATAFACGLIAHGMQKGASVCLLMSNVPEWPISNLGIILAGGVGVGLYPTSSAEQCQYIINHSDAQFLLVDTEKQLEKILRVRAGLPQVRSIIVVDEDAAARSEGLVTFSDFLNFGREHRDQTEPIVRERADHLQLDDIANIVYTSGTTGRPKGACLSHRYVLNSVRSLHLTIPLNDSDTGLSYLPYCHVAELISGLYNRMYAGVTAYLVDDLSTFWDDVRDVQPTVFASLPRFFEKAYARIMADVELARPEEKAAFHRAVEIGRRVGELRRAKQPIPDSLQKAYEQADEEALQRVRSYLGGRARYATSGGAPLSRELEEFFEAIGLPILQAYGLTENVCVAFNRPEHYKFGTVGPPMPGCEVKIAEDGEILVRSEMMFSGYYKEPDKTAEVLSDGWLHTGDLGELDEEGFLKITGRKKELIVTSTGKNISPLLLENMLKEHPLISQAMVYGDNKSYLVALITLNPHEAMDYARAKSLECSHLAELTRHPEIINLVQTIVDKVNARVSSTEAIRKFTVLEKDFTLEDDEITPTMKVKRNVVSERYRDILEGMYG